MAMLKKKQIRKVANPSRPINSNVGRLVKTRNSRVHISSLMLLGIVQEVVNVTGDAAFIGEIEAFYLGSSGYREGSQRQYSYGGISSMLRSMSERGYLIRAREGQYCSYRLSASGAEIVSTVSAA